VKTIIITHKGAFQVVLRDGRLVFFPMKSFFAEKDEMLFSLSMDDLQRLVDMAEEGL
jgi:hypothetical protein